MRRVHESPPAARLPQGRAWRLSRLRRPLTLGLLLAGPALAAAGFLVVGAYEQERLDGVFEDLLARRAQHLERQALSYVETLHALRGLFDASVEVTEHEFDTFAGAACRRHRGILALGWAPDGPDEAGRVAFVQPEPARAAWAGASLAGGVERAAALERARRLPRAALTEPHALAEAAGERGCVLFLAVGGGPGAGDFAPGPRPRGVVLLAFGLAALLDAAERADPPAAGALADVALRTEAAGRGAGFGARPAGTFGRGLRLADQAWRLSARPSAGFRSAHQSASPGWVALGVLVVWECFVAVLLAVGHAVRSHAVAREGRTLAHAVQSLTDGVVVTDRLGRVRLANPAARRLLASPPPSATESGHWALKGCLLTGDGRQTLAPEQQPLRRALAGEVVEEQDAMVRGGSQAEPRWLRVSAAPVWDEEGGLEGGVLVLRDISAGRRLRERDFEMALAARVQQRFFPARPLEAPALWAAGLVLPAAETCGDYYDAFVLPGGRVCLAVGDVSGHGFGPALVMAEVRAYLRSLAAAEPDPGRVLGRINELLLADLGGDLFVTLLLVVVEGDGTRLRYASAGQTAASVLRADGVPKGSLGPLGPPLGLFEGRVWPTRDGPALAPGDTLVLMTDGAPECPAPDGALLGEERLLAAARAGAGEEPDRLLARLTRTVVGHRGPDPARDDVTFLVARVRGAPAAGPRAPRTSLTASA